MVGRMASVGRSTIFRLKSSTNSEEKNNRSAARRPQNPDKAVTRIDAPLCDIAEFHVIKP